MVVKLGGHGQVVHRSVSLAGLLIWLFYITDRRLNKYYKGYGGITVLVFILT